MSENKCRVIAIFKPVAEHAETVKELLLTISQEVLLEAGCEEYQLHEAVDGRLVFVETWTTRALWEIHNNAPTVARIRAGIKDKLEGDVEVIEMYSL